MRYRWILFDADGTLFDYDRAETEALTAAWAASGMPPEARLLAAYRQINSELWKRFEEGLLEQAKIPRLRFARLLEALGRPGDAEEISRIYLQTLGTQVHLLDGALGLLERLEGRFRLALLTNGLAAVQRPRLAGSPIGRFFSAVLISSEIGAAKPDERFFDAAFERMGRPPREEALMVGDSLSSDIEGGRRYGVDTCWLNRSGDARDGGPCPTYEIRALSELTELL